MNIDLSGKVALVTASTAGIGYAIAKGLAASGAEVIINGRSEHSVNAAMARLQQEVPGFRPYPAVADLSDAAGVSQLLQAVNEVDILVNNAGIYGPQDFYATDDRHLGKLLANQRDVRRSPVTRAVARHGA